MLDIALFRTAEGQAGVRADLAKRGRDPAIVDRVTALDGAWREGLSRLEEMRAERNRAGREISVAKKAGTDAAPLLARMQAVGAELARLEAEVPRTLAERDAALRTIPNAMHPTVPVGRDDSENVEVRSWGGRPVPSFPVRSHVDLLGLLDVADLERAARASGSRFYYLKRDLVLMARALELFALTELSAKGFIAIEPPFMLRREALEGAIDLADFESVIYKVEAGVNEAGKGREPDLYLIATSEHPMAALHMGEILESAQLPLSYAGVSPCFRKEAGAHGKDSKGIFRVHQFSKVEQFVFCDAADSWRIHAELVENAEALYRALGIPYRVVNICTGDLGSIAAKKYDIEAWMPAQGVYREVVSCSNCTDFQARRYNTRHRKNPGDPTQFVHTLNSTAIAVERTLVAILENFQRADGSVAIPLPLRAWMGGRESLLPPG
ncbi:MAG: serine--tRNA ligase [Thermoplasmatota archaeon]